MDIKKQKTLVITAHPSSRGLTHGIAQVLKEEREEKGGSVEILDLYKTDLKQEFLTFEKLKELPDNFVRTIMQNKILEADELIFIHPIWWLSMPAIMKNFIDQNFMSRFAYRYIEGKRFGLLSPRTARVYVTCDAHKWLYFLLGLPFVSTWAVGILIFCGIDVKNFTIIRNMDFTSDEERAIYLQKLKKKSRRNSFIFAIMNFLGRIIRI